MMKIWFTDQGKTTIKSIVAICRRETYRLVVIVGRNQTKPLLDYLNMYCDKKIQKYEINNIDELCEITESGSQLILLHSLVCKSLKDCPVEILKKYCQQRNYELIYAPFSIRKSDIECLYQHELDAGFESFCHGNRWALDIAHETALALSAGVLNCYYAIRNIFVKAYEANPEKMPGAQQCMDVYLSEQESVDEAKRVKDLLRGSNSIVNLLNDPDDDTGGFSGQSA